MFLVLAADGRRVYYNEAQDMADHVASELTKLFPEDAPHTVVQGDAP